MPLTIYINKSPRRYFVKFPFISAINFAVCGKNNINDEIDTNAPAIGLTLYALDILYPSEIMNTKVKIAIEPNQTIPLILINGLTASTNLS